MTEKKVPENLSPVNGADPLLEAPGLLPEEILYLKVLSEVGMPWAALGELWNRHKIRVSMGKVAAWCREHPAFSEAYHTLKAIFADKLALENLQISKDGKVTGGQANLRMQQLNRILPGEYLPAIVQNVHQTITYQAEGGFREEKDDKQVPGAEKISPEQPEKTH